MADVHAVHIFTLCRSGVETIGGEIVIAQILAVVVGGHVVDMYLIALLQVVEEEEGVRHVEDELLHSVAQLHVVVPALW